MGVSGGSSASTVTVTRRGCPGAATSVTFPSAPARTEAPPCGSRWSATWWRPPSVLRAKVNGGPGSKVVTSPRGASPWSAYSRSARTLPSTAPRTASSGASITSVTETPRMSPEVTGTSSPATSTATGSTRGSNHRPAPVLPAGKATRIRGALPEVARTCAATGPRRKKRFFVGPSLTAKARVSGLSCVAEALADIGGDPTHEGVPGNLSCTRP